MQIKTCVIARILYWPPLSHFGLRRGASSSAAELFGQAKSPVLFTAPGRPWAFSVPLKHEGMARRVGATVTVHAPFPVTCGRLSARHRDVFQRRAALSALPSVHRRLVRPTPFGWPVFEPRAGRATHRQRSSSRQVIVPAGGVRRRPGAWGVRSSPARGHRIRLHHQTPHDSALNEQDTGIKS